MKKLLLGLAITILSLGGTGLPVGATDNTTISNTGPGSTNTIETTNDFKCEVKNKNDFEIINNNTQEATSGSATVKDNTTGGDATSGSATNSNGTVIDVQITNTGCVVTAVTPPAPVVPVAPAAAQPVGGKGAITPVAAPQVAAPAVLPNTSAASVLTVIGGLIAALGLAIAGTRFGISLYARSLKS
jgi:hypothetical protein